MYFKKTLGLLSSIFILVGLPIGIFAELASNLETYVRKELAVLPKFDLNKAEAEARKSMGLKSPPSLPSNRSDAERDATDKANLLTNEKFPESLQNKIQQEATDKFKLLRIGERITVNRKVGPDTVPFTDEFQGISEGIATIGLLKIPVTKLPPEILDRLDEKIIKKKQINYIETVYTGPRTRYMNDTKKSLLAQYEKDKVVYEKFQKLLSERSFIIENNKRTISAGLTKYLVEQNNLIGVEQDLGKRLSSYNKLINGLPAMINGLKLDLGDNQAGEIKNILALNDMCVKLTGKVIPELKTKSEDDLRAQKTDARSSVSNREVQQGKDPKQEWLNLLKEVEPSMVAFCKDYKNNKNKFGEDWALKTVRVTGYITFAGNDKDGNANIVINSSRAADVFFKTYLSKDEVAKLSKGQGICLSGELAAAKDIEMGAVSFLLEEPKIEYYTGMGVAQSKDTERISAQENGSVNTNPLSEKPIITDGKSKLPSDKFVVLRASDSDTNGWASEIRHKNTGIEMVYVAPGEFLMSSSANETDRRPYETQHRVKLTKGYYIGKYEVTQGQWESVMGNNPSSIKASGKDAPVETVSWDDCQSFCRKLGSGFRLPTEAEWEYASRGGSRSWGYIYSGSNNLDEVAWYGKNSGKKMHQGGQKKANELGIYDMSGNVWEWCFDWYGVYPSESVTDPTGGSSGSIRALRGGSCLDDHMVCQSASRFWRDPRARWISWGFRLAMDITSAERKQDTVAPRIEKSLCVESIPSNKLPIVLKKVTKLDKDKSTWIIQAEQDIDGKSKTKFYKINSPMMLNGKKYEIKDITSEIVEERANNGDTGRRDVFTVIIQKEGDNRPIKAKVNEDVLEEAPSVNKPDVIKTEDEKMTSYGKFLFDVRQAYCGKEYDKVQDLIIKSKFDLKKLDQDMGWDIIWAIVFLFELDPDSYDYEKTKEIFRTTIKKGANINSENPMGLCDASVNGETVLGYTIRMKEPKLEKLLREVGATKIKIPEKDSIWNKDFIYYSGE